MTCACSPLSPFLWSLHPQPSRFMADPAFYKGASSGMSVNAIQTAAVSRYEKKTGRSQGTVMGISSHSDRLVEEFRARRAKG